MEAKRVETQVDLLNSLGHPWELERRYTARILRERHERGGHLLRPVPECAACSPCSPMGVNARGVAQCSEGHGDFPDACMEAREVLDGCW